MALHVHYTGVENPTNEQLREWTKGKRKLDRSEVQGALETFS